MRKILLTAAASPWLREQATRRRFVRRSVRRFMPGERIDDALGATQALGSDGIGTMLTYLGENLANAEEAAAVTQHYLEALDRIASSGKDAQISLKPTQLGLDLNPELCRRNLDAIVEHAERRNNFVWVDMESSPYVDATLALFRRARERSSRVGLALQAYLYRTAGDVESLLPVAPAIRVVKGAYLEPPHLAYPRRHDVDESFYQLTCRLLAEDAAGRGAFVQIATHDEVLLDRLKRHLDERRVPASAYEFAMLYGIQRRQQHELRRRGLPLRVLISYGEHWFPWYMRRLAERPANVLFVVKNLFG